MMLMMMVMSKDFSFKKLLYVFHSIIKMLTMYIDCDEDAFGMFSCYYTNVAMEDICSNSKINQMLFLNLRNLMFMLCLYI